VNIVLVGGKHFGCLTLHLLASKSDIVVQRVIITDKDDRLGKLAKNLDYDVSVSTPSLVEADMIPDNCDLIITAYTHARISDEALMKSKLGGIGYHPSLLPRHRGKFAVEDTIKFKDVIAGGSIYQLSHKWDEGNIVVQDWCHVRKSDDAGSLWRRELSSMGIRLLSSSIDNLLEYGALHSKPQIVL
jgi:methionyl-tRNA formyltransferase